MVAMATVKESKNMEDVFKLLQASTKYKMQAPPVEESGKLTTLQTEMISWIFNVHSREHADPTAPVQLTGLQKEMLRWILHSNSIQIAMHNDL